MFFTADDLDSISDRDQVRAAELADDVAHNFFIAEQLKSCIYLDNANIVSGLKTGNAITYTGNAVSGVIDAASAVFSSGDIGKRITIKTNTGYDRGIFEITGYTDTTTVSVIVLVEATVTTAAEWYLSFSTISGLSQYNGTTVSVVADGGYLDDFLVSGGAIALETPVSHAVVGYKYRALIKSFPIGFQYGAANTQTTIKGIAKSHLRVVASAGGKFGDSPYRLERIQDVGQNQLNYLPPIPIDGTKQVFINPDRQKDAYFYVVQDEPLPLQICSVMMAADYSDEV
jgi:hypothetical protein